MEDTTSMTMGKRILYHRKRLGLTQDQLADRVGVTAQAVSKWEHDLSCPDVATLPRLAEIFGITTDELLGAQPPADRQREAGPSGNWSFTWRWDRGGLAFALFLILTGGVYVAVTVLNLEVSFWSVLWPMAILFLGFSGCLTRLSVFGVGTMAAGLYFLLVNLGLIPSLITWPIIVGLLLVLCGLSILLEGRKPRVRQEKTRKPKEDGKPLREYAVNDGNIHTAVAFCSHRVLVDTPRLEGGSVDVAFGSLVLDLSGCQQVADGCRIHVDAAFSSLVLQLPKRFRVVTNLDQTGASVEVTGQPEAVCQGAIQLYGDCAFGTLKIQYR